jgi:hypothetical protein
MKAKTTGDGSRWKEGKESETRSENHHVNAENWLELTHTCICGHLTLLKACVLRQEKQSV